MPAITIDKSSSRSSSLLLTCAAKARSTATWNCPRKNSRLWKRPTFQNCGNRSDKTAAAAAFDLVEAPASPPRTVVACATKRCFRDAFGDFGKWRSQPLNNGSRPTSPRGDRRRTVLDPRTTNPRGSPHNRPAIHK